MDGQRGANHRIIPARAGSTPYRSSTTHHAEDHPRSRGEHVARVTRYPSAAGSSPLARGALGEHRDDLGEQRIIPARAGSTNCCATGCTRPRDHPRSRGEHRCGFCYATPASGSSPLARGAPAARRSSPASSRIIPARAGSTLSGSDRPSPESDHPRSRGEHGPAGAGIVDRGGIIPARAGSTRAAGRRGCRSSDHPRSRGEHYPSKYPRVNPAGSSPLARGAPLPRDRCAQLCGIIPARAGSTPNTSLPFQPWSGSSPLARGAPPLQFQAFRSLGIIPARAGSTSAHESGWPNSPDHPRSRGEHIAWVPPHSPDYGSSPLARGALLARTSWQNSERIIPARAGSTACSNPMRCS